MAKKPLKNKVFYEDYFNENEDSSANNTILGSPCVCLISSGYETEEIINPKK